MYLTDTTIGMSVCYILNLHTITLEHVRFCERRVKKLAHVGNVPKLYAQQLKSARERLFTFTGNGRHSVLKTSASSSSDRPTTSPVAAASETSDVDPDAPTAVAPIVTSTSGRVIRRPALYKDTRR